MVLNDYCPMGILMEMRYRWRINGENTAWIDCLARGEEEEKERRESYQTCGFYHIVMPQASNSILAILSLSLSILTYILLGGDDPSPKLWRAVFQNSFSSVKILDGKNKEIHQFVLTNDP
jgi:hypothetical protein